MSNDRIDNLYINGIVYNRRDNVEGALPVGVANYEDDIFYIKTKDYIPSYLLRGGEQHANAIELFCDKFRVEEDGPTVEFPTTEEATHTAQAKPRLIYSDSRIDLKNELYDIPSYSDVRVSLENTDGRLNHYVQDAELGITGKLMLIKFDKHEELANQKPKVIRSGIVRTVSSNDSNITFSIGDERKDLEKDFLRKAGDIGLHEIADIPIPIAYGRNVVQGIDTADGTNRFLFFDSDFADYNVQWVYYYKNEKIKTLIKRTDYTSDFGIINFNTYKTLQQYQDNSFSFNSYFRRSTADIRAGREGNWCRVKLERYKTFDTINVLYQGNNYPLDLNRYKFLDKHYGPELEINTEGTVGEDGVKIKTIDEIEYYIGDITDEDFPNIRLSFEIFEDIYVRFTSQRVQEGESGGVPSDMILTDLTETYSGISRALDYDIQELEGQSFHPCNLYITEGSLLSVIEEFAQKSFLYFFVNTNDKYTIRQYDFQNLSDKVLTADIALDVKNDNLQYASLINVKYGIEGPNPEDKNTVYSNEFTKTAITNYKNKITHTYHTNFVDEQDAQALANFLAEKLASKQTSVDLTTSTGYENLSLYDRVEFDGKRGFSQVLKSAIYYVVKIDIVKGKVSLKRWNV